MGLNYLFVKKIMQNYNWDVSPEEKSRILNLHESATKRQYLNEQMAGASEVSASTDKNRISHALLSKSYGLPAGSEHETFYYVSDVFSILGQSRGDRTAFLSQFKPLNDTNTYVDYFSVGDQSLTNAGSKTFNFKQNAKVVASHNGLLALVRAMDRMKGSPSVLTITFSDNRQSQSVTFNSNKAFNISPGIVGLQNHLALLSINDISKSTLYNRTYTNSSTPQIEKMIGVYLNSFINGSVGFMDGERQDEILRNLIPKGFVTKLDFNLQPIINELKQLKQYPDFEEGEISETKLGEINAINEKYTNQLLEKLKAVYTNNFKIYIENYLPNSKDELLNNLGKIYLKNYTLVDAYKSALTSRVVGTGDAKSTLDQKTQSYKSGQ
jgi:hypothetical protein